MNFSDFITSCYADVNNKHSQTLTQLKEAAVRQLQELSVRRVDFMEASTTFTLPTREPYNGEWAGEGIAGFPLDILEVDGLYFRTTSASAWTEIPGPVTIQEIRTWDPPLRSEQLPVSIHPLAWAFWEGKIWVPRVTGNVELRLDYFRDGTRDEATGVLISSASEKETNGWLRRGLQALRAGVLADYYLMAASRDETQAAIEQGRRNLYLENLNVERRMSHGSAFQAPVNL